MTRSSTQSARRQLGAILFADVVGYSRLMGEDEAGTHKTVSAFLDMFATAIEGHKGAVVHYAGDAVLVATSLSLYLNLMGVEEND